MYSVFSIKVHISLLFKVLSLKRIHFYNVNKKKILILTFNLIPDDGIFNIERAVCYIIFILILSFKYDKEK